MGWGVGQRSIRPCGSLLCGAAKELVGEEEEAGRLLCEVAQCMMYCCVLLLSAALAGLGLTPYRVAVGGEGGALLQGLDNLVRMCFVFLTELCLTPLV